MSRYRPNIWDEPSKNRDPSRSWLEVREGNKYTTSVFYYVDVSGADL